MESGGPAPLVSILTPSFNQGCWLRDNIESVEMQTFLGIEHVIMDGGSTDETVEILEAAGPRVRWRSQVDRGQSHALNMALELSEGEILGWLNSDDAYLHPDAVASVVDVFSRNPDTDVVYGHAVLATSSGLPLQVLHVPRYSLSLLRLANYIIQPAVFMRRRVVSEGIADERFDYAMDHELWLRLSAEARFERIDRVLALDRHHLRRKSYTRLDLAAADEQRLIAMYGIPSGPAARAASKLAVIALRLSGIAQVWTTDWESSPAVHLDSRAALTARQVFVPRARMPIE